jgi:hypothetical protein
VDAAAAAAERARVAEQWKQIHGKMVRAPTLSVAALIGFTRDKDLERRTPSRMSLLPWVCGGTGGSGAAQVQRPPGAVQGAGE